MQSRLTSFIEAVLNVGSGYILALGTQLVIFPWFDIEVDFSEQLGIAAIFTFISVIRTYLWRRVFNLWEKPKKKTAKWPKTVKPDI